MLRYVPDLPHWGNGNVHTLHPAMLAKFVATDGRSAILHRTYLVEPGIKAKLPGEANAKSYMPGKVPTGDTVRLAPAMETLGIAEGVETALSASILFSAPVGLPDRRVDGQVGTSPGSRTSSSSGLRAPDEVPVSWFDHGAVQDRGSRTELAENSSNAINPGELDTLPFRGHASVAGVCMRKARCEAAPGRVFLSTAVDNVRAWPTNRSSEAARVGCTARLKNFGGGFGTGGGLALILSRSGRGECTGRRPCGFWLRSKLSSGS